MNPVDGGDEYENPNTSSRESSQSDDRAEAAIESQLRHMIRVESKRVLQHADDKNFLTWMENWYCDWEKTLGDKMEELGLDRDSSQTHCEESKRLLLEATNSKPEDFRKTLENCVESWENRVFSVKNNKEHEQCLP
jgi:hypothetical protein